MRFPLRFFAPLAAVVSLFTGAARADVLLDTTDLVGLPVVAPASEHAFSVTTPGPLTVTLSDLTTPSPFVSLQIAVTLGDVVVGNASVSGATHTASLSLPGDAGNYVLHVVGSPDPTQGIGSFEACVAPAANAAGCVSAYSFSDNLETPTAASSSSTPSSALQTNFTSTAQGVYSVLITDDQFPAALQSLSGGIGLGSTPVTSLALGTTMVTLAAATQYSLTVGALADANLKAGLYGVQITDPTGAVVFQRTVPVAGLASATSVNNPAAQPLNVTLTDYGYPTALAGVGVALTQGGGPALASATMPSTVSNITVPAGNVQVWQYAVAGAQPGVYSLAVSSSTASLLSVTTVVNPAANSSSTTQSYAFAVNLPTAGTYNLVVNDLQFPAALSSISSTIAQDGAALTVSSTGDFPAAAGYVIVVVTAGAPASGNGIFGVTVQTSGASPTVLLDQTQAVGGVFTTRTVTPATAGSYDITLTDLGFPTTFASLDVAVSRGSQLLGKVYGGGPLTLAVSPGQYDLTFVATPGAQSYGLYAIRMASSAPVVTLTTGATSVTVGQPVQLTWSTTGASACTASGATGWNGTEPISGTAAVTISATTTLSLMCTGSGGSASQSVNIVATAAPAKSGGGGSVGWVWLICLAGLAASVRGHAMLRNCKHNVRPPVISRR